MLVEDPDERSSADYCHDKALKLLQRINDARRPESTPSDTESSDDDDGSSTPKPSIQQSDVESESADEASTIRLNPQSDSRDGSETPRRTVESINSSLIANLGYRDGSLIDSLVNPTDCEEKWERSGAPDPDTQPAGEHSMNCCWLQCVGANLMEDTTRLGAVRANILPVVVRLVPYLRIVCFY